MIRAVLHLASEAIWALVFKVAERFPLEPRPEGWEDAPQSTAEATAARTRWINEHRPGRSDE